MFVEEKVEVVLVNEVLDAEIFDFLKQHRIKILYRALTPDVANSQQAEKLGADIIVATGFDEGGTVPSRIIGTFSIVPIIADSVKIPVLAAGGIGGCAGRACSHGVRCRRRLDRQPVFNRAGEPGG
ncbi:putative enoyl-[acyl-carrier-protein] reductase II [Pantoea agglomerans]|uniref:Putative enoyl-[acyl-carrier-protein] reductase II n=1 Tax=Enterobacter agglomerans TaxID=549 RepID=A0A379LSZ7_ENTAG|nr:putative enoyl-[acyl-carrier-protein] reductase II [Pantoea agglomerans]